MPREVWPRPYSSRTRADGGFYRCLGFTVESLGERYPGVERFRCTLPLGDAKDPPLELGEKRPSRRVEAFEDGSQ